MDIAINIQLTLVLIAFFAGLISSIAGSRGLLTLPALLSAGLPPLNALATNQVQSSLGTMSSACNFFRKGHLDVKPLGLSLACSVLGSVVGTMAVQSLDNSVLTRLRPFLLLAIALYFLVSPTLSDVDHPQRMSRRWFALSAALGIGFYGGFFGPGMGSIMPFLFVWLLGHNLVKATAETKLMFLAVNGTCALIFVFSGYFFWQLATVMSLAQIVGARMGFNLIIKGDASLVQPIITVVTMLMVIKLLFFP